MSVNIRQMNSYTQRFQPVLLLLSLLFLAHGTRAQSIDRIQAIVGEDVILQSDIESQYAYLKANGQKDDGTLRCQILEKIIIEKLLLNKARQDSIVVGDDQVDGELERKLQYFIQGYGGVEKVEEIYRKPLIEIKADLRPDIKDQLMIERMRQKVISDVKITPREVKKFYGEIPVDSLPLLPAEVELFHLVKRPQATQTAAREAQRKLRGIREDIVAGTENFEDMARKWSEDFGSAKVGGSLGQFGRGKMVPEFEEVAFKTKEGEVSDVFKSAYGFHIIKVDKRVGELITAKHILIAPRLSLDDDSVAVRKLQDIRDQITGADTLSFSDAAMRHSDDEATKTCGGCVKNPQTGETRIPHDMLDADFYLKVDNMKEGDISEPMEWIQPDGKKAFHILYLKRRIAPHVANLKEDYQKIQSAALQAKQAQELEGWFDKAKRNVYIDIKYPECREVLINWIQ